MVHGHSNRGDGPGLWRIVVLTLADVLTAGVLYSIEGATGKERRQPVRSCLEEVACGAGAGMAAAYNVRKIRNSWPSNHIGIRSYGELSGDGEQ